MFDISSPRALDWAGDDACSLDLDPSFAYAPVGCPAMIGWVMPLAVAVISMKQK